MFQTEKISPSWAFRSIASKLFSPKHWIGMNRVSKQGPVQRVSADAQLKLYADLLPGGFVHLGYFEDPHTPAEAVSLLSLSNAQRRHAELIIEKISKSDLPVLDVGCGMGGLLKFLKEQGFKPTGLTPDRYQADYLREQLSSEVEIIRSRFEDLSIDNHTQRYGTVITSESLQYLDKRIVLPIFEKILTPLGRWIICDYLRLKPGHPWSFSWPEFHQALSQSKAFKVVEERDITAHIMPTLRYVHLLGQRVALPVVHFMIEKIKGKEPKIGYLFNDIFAQVEKVVDSNVSQIDPQMFALEKSYRLVVLERI